MNRRNFLKGLFAVVATATTPVHVLVSAPLVERMNDHLYRSEIWSKQIKKLLMEELCSMDSFSLKVFKEIE